MVNVHLNDHNYLAFYVPGIGQVQSTCMPQGARTSFFIFGELINIVLRPIPSSQLEPLLFYRKTAKDTVYWKSRIEMD